MKTTALDLFKLLSDRNESFAKTGRFLTSDLTAICKAENIPLSAAGAAVKLATRLDRGSYVYTPGVAPAAAVKPTRQPRVDVEMAKPSLKVIEPELHEVTRVTTAVHEAVQRFDLTAQVPLIDSDYIPFGEYKDLETIIKSKMFYPVLITGHSGNGKTMSVTQACAKFKRPMIRINCTKTTDAETLIGSKTLIDGNVVITEGPMLTSMRNGSIIILDEFSASDPNAILCLQGILEGGAYYFALTGEYVYPKEGFNVFLTDNTKGQGSDDGRYVGTNILNEAFLERVGMVIEQEYPSLAVEKKITIRKMENLNCVNEKFADDLVKWAEAIRRTFADGGVDSVITTRRLAHIVKHYSIFTDTNKAVKACCARFDEMTKMAFITLWEKISAVEPAPKTTEVPF